MTRWPGFVTTCLVALMPACGGAGHDASSASAASGASSSSASGSGGSGAGGAATGGAGGGTFQTALHEPYPTLKDHGGPVLAHPHVVTVTFSGYAYEAAIQGFGAWIPTSDWLAEVGADYGVSKGAHVADVVLTDSPPAVAMNKDSIDLLLAKMDDGTLPDPATIEDPIYLLYYPKETVTHDFTGELACNGIFGGYHWEAKHGSTKFAFAVLPACSSDPRVEPEAIESIASHELIEASTDPFPVTALGWSVDFDDPWSALDGEAGDMCEFMLDVPYPPYFVTRVWSNSAAAAGRQPCIPAKDGPLYGVTPSPTGIVRVAAGASQVFELAGWSDSPIAPWRLETIPFGAFTPTASLSAKTIQNGDTVELTVGVPAGAQKGARGNLLVYSVRDYKTGDYAYWPIVVTAR